jgi:acyl-CoA synthetase (AMP-forming)/AMP-acid ligase II
VLIELVRAGAEAEPERPLSIGVRGASSYGLVLVRAQALAAGLEREGIERFGSVVSAPEEIVVVLAGASARGSEACLYPRDLPPSDVQRFAGRFGHETVVADDRFELDGVRVRALAELELEPGTTMDPQERTPVMILTTGTTGEPKGARYDWRALVRAVRHPDPHPGTRWLLAYNLNQFAGIQILLHVLASRGTLVVPKTRRAEDVIDSIRSHAVTHVSATPTFWRLVVGRLDPPSARELPLKQITLGGEAAPESLISRLRELFPQARISHVYAGTEFGSVVSVRDGHSGLPASILERDETADVRFKIVDGELHIASRVGMLGYHGGNDDATEWRATGDLVEVRGERIHFVGRKTEIINVGGAKVHPLPVEEAICAVNGVELAAVYGRPNPITGQIVAADVVASPGVDTEELAARIKSACQALPAAGRPRRIRFVEELEIRGNKLMRKDVVAQ